jgi:hypothetical protein
MSYSPTFVTDNPKSLSAIKIGKYLSCIWQRQVPHDVQKCLDDFNTASLFNFSSGLRYLRPSKHIELCEDDIKHYPSLAPFFEEVKALKELYKTATGNVRVRAKITVFKPGVTDEARDWHQDVLKTEKKPKLMRRADGLAIFASKADDNSAPTGGALEYIDGSDMGDAVVFDASGENILGVEDSKIKRMKSGNFSLHIHAANVNGKFDHGLVHKGTAVENGYRWRVILTPC